MSKPVFIWDLDGTLLDSYGIIVDSLCKIYKEKFDIELNKEEVHKEVIRYSVGALSVAQVPADHQPESGLRHALRLRRHDPLGDRHDDAGLGGGAAHGEHADNRLQQCAAGPHRRGADAGGILRSRSRSEVKRGHLVIECTGNHKLPNI